MNLLLNEIGRVRSLVEIGIFTILLYMFLQFIRGTRGAAVLKGTLLFGTVGFVGLTLVADWFQLERVRMLVTWAAALSGFALVVIFGPELRRGFSLLAGSLVRLGKRSREEKAIRGIVEACFSMARRRIGALITLERETALDDLIESGGTKIDAETSPELLQTIFHPGSPLHDGAAIIREGKVAAAGVIMPLTQNPNIPKELGTRHRAAIGVSEETDAVSIIVSEETGRVSLCERGQITLGLDPQSLELKLHDMFLRGRTDRGFRGLLRATHRKFVPRSKPARENGEGNPGNTP